MNNRLQLFLDVENISQSQLADTLSVARASVSHILAGRNKPSYDFINGMIANFPKLNIEWLLSGKGRMYKESSVPVTVRTEEEAPADLFTIPAEPAISPQESDIRAQSPAASSNSQIPEVPKDTQLPVNQRRISRIVVFFDDNTFEELS